MKTLKELIKRRRRLYVHLGINIVVPLMFLLLIICGCQPLPSARRDRAENARRSKEENLVKSEGHLLLDKKKWKCYYELCGTINDSPSTQAYRGVAHFSYCISARCPREVWSNFELTPQEKGLTPNN